MVATILMVICVSIGLIEVSVGFIKDDKIRKILGAVVVICGLLIRGISTWVGYENSEPQIYTTNGNEIEDNYICIKAGWAEKIYYTLEPYADPAVDGIEYTEPILITGSVVVSAKAQLLGTKWSKLAVRYIVVKDGEVIVEDKDSDIKSLSVSLSDYNREYKEGDVLNCSDFVVKATWNNGEVTQIDNFEITPNVISAGENIVVISYGKNKCEIEIQGLESKATDSETGTLNQDEVTTEVSKVVDAIPDVSGMHEFSGHFDNEKQVNKYKFVPEVSGTYRFDFEAGDVNTGYSFYVIKADGEEKKRGYYSDSGKTVELDSGQEYYLNVEQLSGLPNYTIKIGIPQGIMDVTGNSIEHALTYEDQKDEYMYTAPITGKYRLNFFSDDTTSSYKVEIRKPNKERVAYAYYSDSGKTVDLDAGESYKIVVEQTNGFAGYKIEICVPNEEKQVTDNIINGSLWYEDQLDNYTYIAPVTGKYRFDFGSNNVNNSYSFQLRDTTDNRRLVYGSFSDKGKNAELEAGKKYLIQIQQHLGTEEYTINIGVPQPTKWVDGNSISGKITYIDQVDVYQYIAPISGKYTFEFDTSDVQCNYNVKVCSEKNETLMSTDASYKDKPVQLEAGQTYTIYVIQRSGYVEYTINIGEPEN